MKPAPNLRDLQYWLKWVITDPRGVLRAIDDPATAESQLRWIGDERVSAVRRLDVYAEGYFFRILDCLAKDFPKTKQALGGDSFSNLVSQYLKAFPSKSPIIDEVGYRFADFVSEQLDLSHGWIPDLALLEWSQIEAFYAPETNGDANWWESADLENGADLCLQVHPSVRLIQSRWSLPQVLDALDLNDSIHPDSYFLEPSFLIVYRHGDFHCWDEVGEPMFKVLQKLRSGHSLAQATSMLDDGDAAELSIAFSRWVGRGVLCGIGKA